MQNTINFMKKMEVLTELIPSKAAERMLDDMRQIVIESEAFDTFTPAGKGQLNNFIDLTKEIINAGRAALPELAKIVPSTESHGGS